MTWAKPTMSEEQLHIAIAQYLDAVIRKPAIWTTIDAGAGKMGKAAAGRRKARGVKRGWPDILIFAPGPNVLGIELKSESGRLSPEQRAVEHAFFDCQAWFVLCRSIDDVERALRFCKIPTALVSQPNEMGAVAEAQPERVATSASAYVKQARAA
jgi:hypothetical protein